MTTKVIQCIINLTLVFFESEFGDEDDWEVGSSTRTRLRGEVWDVESGGILNMIGFARDALTSGGCSKSGKSTVGINVGVWVMNFGF